MVLESKTQRVSRDPFAVKPLPKAYYHPSKHKNLSKTQRKTALSNPLSEESNNDSQPKQPEDEVFLKGGNRYVTKTPPPEDNASSKFDESWPSSERPSSLGLTGTDDKSPYSLQQMLDLYGRKGDYSDIKQTLSFTETECKDTTGEQASTLQRYIERFRRGQPMSREDRQRQTAASSKDFWWINPSQRESETETPNREYEQRNAKRQSVKKVLEGSPPDEVTKRLQERADRLLERSVSTVASSEPIVSTDGLGSSSDGSMSSFEEQPYRPAFARNLDSGPSRRQYDRGPVAYPNRSETANFYPRVSKPARPEDDILHQWRVKRRLETARDVAEQFPANKNTFGFLSKQSQSDQGEIDAKLTEFKERLSGKRTPVEPQRLIGDIRFTPVPKQKFMEDESSENTQKPDQRGDDFIPTIASPSLGRRTKQTGVEPHLHLMCDLLPCQHSQQFTEKTYLSKENENSDHQSSQSKVCQNSSTVDERVKGDSDSTKKDMETGRYKYLEAERPNVDVGLAKPPSKHSESKSRNVDNAQNSVIRNEKDSKEQENFCVNSDHQQSNEMQQKGKDLNGGKEKEKIPQPRECHSPSMKKFESVNSAIGQVIKDRLFTSSLSTVIDSVDTSTLDPNRQSVEFTESTRITPHNLSDQSDLSPPDPKPPKGLSTPDSKLKDKKAGTRKERLGKTTKSMSSNDKGRSERNLTELDNEESYESDGEFPDDQLLQILRAQRSSYEEKLGHIDKLLSQLSPVQ